MSIQVIKQTHGIDTLIDAGAPARPLSTPPSLTRDLGVSIAGTHGHDLGVWECTPGRFERVNEYAEVMHMLSGQGTFTPTTGEPISFKAGDTVFFPSNTFGVWDIKETVRKVYVIFSGQ